MRNLKENITITILVIIIVMSAFLIGSPLNVENIQPVFIISCLLSIFYYLIKKEKIIVDKIDICILIFAISTLLPVLFKTYVSLSGTIYSVMKYFCILNLFLIAKKECKKNPKYIHIILNIIILCILIECIFAIDEITGNYLEGFKEIIGNVNVELKESRIDGLFGYTNTLAAVASVGFFLCIGYIFNSKKIKVKFLYFIMSIVMLVTLILTYSRLMFIVFAAMVILFILVLLKKYKIKFKTTVALSVFLITVVGYIIVGLQIPSDLIIQSEFKRNIYNIQGDTDYNFLFEVESNSNNKKTFVIEISEYDVYLNKIASNKIKFGSFSGIKQIKIHTQPETTTIYVKIKNKDESGILNIKDFQVNGERVILNYKFLPTNLVVKIKEIDFTHKSAWQRFIFIRDAFKSIKENWLVGYGGYSWEDMQLKLQEYNYYVKDMHTFPIQIFFENGIFGFIACLGIYVYVFKVLYKQVKKQDIDIVKIGATISLLSLLLHCVFDLDMSYFFVLLIAIMILSTFESEENYEYETANLLQKIIISFLIVVSIFTVYASGVQNIFENKKEEKISSYIDKKENFETLHKLAPYNLDILTTRYNILLGLNNPEHNLELMEINEWLINHEKYYYTNLNLRNILDYVKIILQTNENVNGKLEFALESVCDTEQFSKYRPNIQILRFTRLKSIIEHLYRKGQFEYANKFNEQLIKEIEDKTPYILDYTKSTYSKDMVSDYKDSINELITFAENMNNLIKNSL